MPITISKDMIDPYRVPYGSIDENVYIISGTGGKDRHAGNFSPDNPYLEQLSVANNNQDKDALYERAVAWEAEHAKLLEQRAYDKQVLAEQRAYDDPVNQVARQRAAGINPDLPGGSSGGTSSVSSGSSAQLTPRELTTSQAQTKFSNSYDNTSLVFDGINAAANFTGALTSGVSSIMNSVSQLKVLPSQIAINEANASLSGAKANEIEQLLKGRKNSLSLSNVAQGIQNSTAILEQLAQFSQLIAPDTADFAPHLQALGVPDSQIPAYTQMIKQMHANPEMRDKFAKAEVAAKWSEAENDTYTEQLVGGMTDLQAKITYEQKHWDFHRIRLQSNIAKLLDTDSYADQVADNLVEQEFVKGNSLGVQNEQLNLTRQQLKHDTQVFLQGLVDRAGVLDQLDASINDLLKKPRTAQNAAQINKLRAERIAVRQLLSSQFNELKYSFLEAAQQSYISHAILTPGGFVKDEGDRAKSNYFLDLTFNDLVHHTRTAGQIANDWVDSSLKALDVGVNIATSVNGYKFTNAYKSAHSKP